MTAADTIAEAPETSGPPKKKRPSYSLWRMRGYLRPYRGALTVMASTAVVGVFVSLAIPLVTKAIIDGPITDREIGPLIPLGALALALGIAEAGLIFAPRGVEAAGGRGFETHVRGGLYPHLQGLPLGVHR